MPVDRTNTDRLEHRPLLPTDKSMAEHKGKVKNTSLAAKGALAHCLQRRTACKIQYGSKMANGVWKGVYLSVFGHSKQL